MSVHNPATVRQKPDHLITFARAHRKAGNPAEMALWSALKGMRSEGLHGAGSM
jgi:very-short-patch-repair endonuclease